MRGFFLGFGVATALLLAAPLLAETWVKVEPGKGGDLAARVLILERAVAQLQGKESLVISASNSEGPFHCTLKTPFNGTFSASAATEAAARLTVASECNARSKGNLYCEEKAAECGKK